MKSVFARLASVLLTVTILMLVFSVSATAQTTTSKSRVAVVSNETKTNIWVSNFPKQTAVVITDADNNLLSIVSTNEYGAAFITLPTGVKTSITAKTINGEIIASNKAVIKNKQEENNVVANDVENSNRV